MRFRDALCSWDPTSRTGMKTCSSRTPLNPIFASLSEMRRSPSALKQPAPLSVALSFMGVLFGCVGVQGQCGPLIGTFPYSEGFEASAAWTSGGTGNDWAWGTPAHPLINSAGGGSKSWCVGGLTGSYYNSNERSYLESPCFDFTNLNTPADL